MTKKSLYFILIPLLLLASSCSRVDSEDALKQAYLNAKDTNYNEALHFCEICLNANYKSLVAYTIKGLCLNRLNQKHEAKECFIKALNLEGGKEDFWANYYYGCLLYEDEKYNDAVAPLKVAYKKINDYNEREIDILIMLAHSSLEGNLSSTPQYLIKLKNNPAFKSNYLIDSMLGYYFFHNGPKAIARSKFLKATKTASDNAIAWQNLAVYYDISSTDDTKDYAKIMKNYRKALIIYRRNHDPENIKFIQERLQQLAIERISSE